MSNTIDKVVIIIPTYNEELVIANTLEQVFRVLEACQDFVIHILVMDSASLDSTRQIVTRMQETNPNLFLLTEKQKTGLGSAYFQAMNYALTNLAADIVIEFDADLSHQPKYLVKMLNAMHTHDVVIGSRYINGGSIPKDWGWHRKVLSIAGNAIARAILTPKYHDFTSGFRATRAIFLKQALNQEFLSLHYAYKLHLLWSLHKTSARITEIPIQFIDRSQGESKLPGNSILDSLRVIFTLRILEIRKGLASLFRSVGFKLRVLKFKPRQSD